MQLEGGCYCKSVRYVAEGQPAMKGECHCRECQYITGGGPNFFMMMPADGFRYVQGAPSSFARGDLPKPVTREFCPTCGTHLVTRIGNPNVVVVKVGTLDDPKAYGGPDMAIFMKDTQPFHHMPEGMPAYQTTPGR